MVGNVGGCRKGLEKLVFETTTTTKKDVMDAINVKVSIGENKISYSKINESGNDFMDNLYDHGLVTNYILNKLFNLNINIYKFEPYDN
jgi:hypothetical protein